MGEDVQGQFRSGLNRTSTGEGVSTQAGKDAVDQGTHAQTEHAFLNPHQGIITSRLGSTCNALAAGYEAPGCLCRHGTRRHRWRRDRHAGRPCHQRAPQALTAGHPGAHPGERFNPTIVRYLQFARGFSGGFPGFETDTHGLLAEKTEAGLECCVDCVRQPLPDA